MPDTSGKTNDFYITREVEKRMGVWNPRDEEMHPELRAVNPSLDLNETQQFGFSIPEEDIHALCYTWYHPNAHLISTGVMVCQGIRPIAPGMEIMDYRGFVSADELQGTFLKYRTSNNYEVEVIEPGVKFRTKYLDKDRNNSFDIVHTALHPPCLWSSNVHFEQPMRNEGELVIRGKRHDVNGTQTRDRSWAETRSEMPRNVPPVGWVTGIFDNGFCFHVTAFDSPELDPVWKGHFDVPVGRNLRFGWVIVDGRQAAVLSVDKRTTYDRDWMPETMELVLHDEHGRDFVIKGHVTAGFPFNAWHNCRWPICLARWTLDGVVSGYGDIQDGHWGDFLLAMNPR
jgi:hypothetical protein